MSFRPNWRVKSAGEKRSILSGWRIICEARRHGLARPQRKPAETERSARQHARRRSRSSDSRSNETGDRPGVGVSEGNLDFWSSARRFDLDCMMERHRSEVYSLRAGAGPIGSDKPFNSEPFALAESL